MFGSRLGWKLNGGRPARASGSNTCAASAGVFKARVTLTNGKIIAGACVVSSVARHSAPIILQPTEWIKQNQNLVAFSEVHSQW